MNKWESCQLGDVLTLQRGFDLPLQKRQVGKVPIVASKGIVGSHNEDKVGGPGVVIGRSGSIGGGQFISKDFWPLNTTLWVKDFKGNDVRYCYYLLKNIDFSTYNVGSGVPTLNRNHIHPHPVMLPTLAEQKAIVSVLGALDDKIENNRRMNETLEEMARAIFKSWFVDFDPVHAKAAGNAPAHMDADTAALFPSSFGDDGLPNGWCEEALYNIATFINGAAFKTKQFCDECDGLPVVKIAELKNGISAQTKFTNTDLGEKYKIASGDIFFAWSGSPQTSINTFVWPFGDAWLNQHIFAIRENGFASLAYLYMQMKVLNPKFIAIALDKQTTGLGHVTVRDMKELLVISAPDQIKKRFEQVAGPIFEKIRLNLTECQTLVELSDSLLPKLMSGEIRVADAEREVEAAV